LRVPQDEDNGEVAARPSLPPQHQVTKHIMQTWMLHEQMQRNLPTDRMRDVHKLHQENSVPNAGLNPILPDGGCPMQAVTGHGWSGLPQGR